VHAVFLQLLACKEPPCDGVEAQSMSLVSWKYSELTHQAAQAQHQFWSLPAVYTPLLARWQQCRSIPCCGAPNFDAKWSSPQTAGDWNISNHSILYTFKLHARRIGLFTACPDVLNPLSVMNSTVTKIQLKTWIHFPTSNTLKASQPLSLNHRHLLCRGWKYTPAPVLRWVITLLRHGYSTLRFALRGTYKTIPSTDLWCVKSSNISSVGWRWMVWRRTMTTYWKKKRPLCV